MQVGGGLAQMPSTPDLPGEDPIHLGVIQGAQRGGADLASGMHDAGQRRQLCSHGGQQAGDVVRVGDVGGDDPNFAAVLLGACASMRCCAASPGARRLVSTRCLAPCAAR